MQTNPDPGLQHDKQRLLQKLHPAVYSYFILNKNLLNH